MENVLCEDIRFLTSRALWEMENLIKCIPNDLLNKRYDGIPMWKFVYHTLYSMDRWFINPCDSSYCSPEFHTDTLANLNVIPKDEALKVEQYVLELTDSELAEKPENCDMTRFRLILGQYRHWHRHMGIIYGFIVEDTGKWPYVLNMSGEYPSEEMPNYY